MVPEDRSPQSAVMEHHNKQVEGPERLFRFMAAHFTVPADWESYFHTGQLLQAEALRCAVEHWRRRKYRTAGALFWQLNDCWPVTSWAVIDSDLRPKAALSFCDAGSSRRRSSRLRSVTDWLKCGGRTTGSKTSKGGWWYRSGR